MDDKWSECKELIGKFIKKKFFPGRVIQQMSFHIVLVVPRIF